MSKVFIERCYENQIAASLDKLLDRLGGLKQYISEGDKVFIKPNMFLNERPETGRTTHPGLVLALARKLHQMGASVTVGERNGNINDVFQDYGYEEIYKYARVVDLDQEEFRLKDPLPGNYVINFPIPVAKAIDEADFIINMPGLRTHVLTKMSNALKNVMGFLPRNTTRLVHLAGLDEAIVDLNRTFKIDLIITDAIYSLQGCFPADGGEPLKSEFIMASIDPVAIDAAAAKIIGYQAEEINPLLLAADKGLGEMEHVSVEIEGELERKLEKLSFNLPKPAEYENKYRELFNIYSDNACDRCRRALVNGIFAFFEEYELTENDPTAIKLLKEINLITGKSYPGNLDKGYNLIYGNCAKSYFGKGIYEQGCPPLTGAAKRRIKEYYDELLEKNDKQT